MRQEKRQLLLVRIVSDARLAICCGIHHLAVHRRSHPVKSELMCDLHCSQPCNNFQITHWHLVPSRSQATPGYTQFAHVRMYASCVRIILPDRLGSPPCVYLIPFVHDLTEEDQVSATALHPKAKDALRRDFHDQPYVSVSLWALSTVLVGAFSCKL